MACDNRIPLGMTLTTRKKQIEEAVDRLEKALAIGTVKVKVGPTGAVAFDGWRDRDGVNDVCAYRKLTARSSVALRSAVVKAEAMAGRKVDPQAVASGTHSHDGGKTWGKGH